MNLMGNWHPILVHFPVALLTLYAGLMALAFVWKAKREALNTAAKFLVLLGALGAVVAAMAGEGLEARVEALNDPMISATLIRHSLYAGLTQTLAIVATVFQFWPLVRKYLKFIKFNIPFLLQVLLAGLVFVSLLLTASEGGKLAHTYHVGEKANIEIAHPVGGVSGKIIPDSVINLLEKK